MPAMIVSKSFLKVDFYRSSCISLISVKITKLNFSLQVSVQQASPLFMLSLKQLDPFIYFIITM